MLDLDDSNVWVYKKKKQLLFFNGPFIPNGIASSFMNLMTSIKDSEYEISLLINREDILKSNERLDELEKLPSNVRIISRVGQTPMTLEEIGETFDLTRERVRQIKEKAIRRLKHTSRSKILKTYLG